MVPPEAVVALGKELTEAGADWQIHAYGHVAPRLHQPQGRRVGIRRRPLQRSSPPSARGQRSINFLEELFG